jgi:hypothetical protein
MHNLSISLFQLRARFPVDNAAHLGLPLVVQLLALGYANFKFYFAALDIHASYDQRHAVSRGGLI